MDFFCFLVFFLFMLGQKKVAAETATSLSYDLMNHWFSKALPLRVV